MELLDFTAFSDQLCLALLDVQDNLVSISGFFYSSFQLRTVHNIGFSFLQTCANAALAAAPGVESRPLERQ